MECPRPAPRYASGEIWRPTPSRAATCVEAFVKANATIVQSLDSAKSEVMRAIESQTLFDGFGCAYSAYGYAFVLKGRLLEAPKSVEREKRLLAIDKLLRKLAMQHPKELAVDLAQARNEMFSGATAAGKAAADGQDGKEQTEEDEDDDTMMTVGLLHMLSAHRCCFV